MAKTIAFFNNKGGVSKTTTCFNVGWMLAELGKKVIMVDADPQCNLTGMIVELGQTGSLDGFYEENAGQNIMSALEPAFLSRPRPLQPVDALRVEGRDGLYLIPGHVGLAEYEVSLGIAQQLSESVQALKNLPGSFQYLFEITAQKLEADFVLIDLSPGLGSINQNLVTTSDFFLVPAAPDIFSVMAIDSLSRVLPRWISWSRTASHLDALASADYPFPTPALRFLGTVVQRYRLRAGEPTEAFQRYFAELESSISDSLIPALSKADVLLPEADYQEAGVEGAALLARIPDFNTLIANSQQSRKPVFALDRDDIRRRGVVWEQQKSNIDSFHQVFEDLANRILSLTA